MSSDADARRIASGPAPSKLVPADGGVQQPTEPPSRTAQPYDPLRLCVYATIALLGWLGGPATLVVFAALGFAGYWKAWRGGLRRSKCFLRDTRLVLGYFAALAAAGIWGSHALVANILGA